MTGVVQTGPQSIHPRVVGGRTVHEKVNTAKPYKKGGKGKLGKKMAKLNRRRLAHSSTLKTPGVQAESFRMPASMNQRAKG